MQPPPPSDPTGALVLFSGGQDSTVCLGVALSRYARVETVGFDYGQRHEVELTCRDRVRTQDRGRFPGLGGAARPRPRHRHFQLRGHRRDRPHLGRRDQDAGLRPAQHLRAGAEPDLLHLCRGARLSPRAARPRRRHVRDRLFRLSRLPRRDPEGPRNRPSGSAPRSSSAS